MTRKPDQQAKEMRSQVFRHMLETRGWKYRAFLRQLRFFKYVAFAPVRGEFLESYKSLSVNGNMITEPFSFRAGWDIALKIRCFFRNLQLMNISGTSRQHTELKRQNQLTEANR
ncbi:MAG: hypothetical protein Q7W54_03345 [Bacteroidota bacterium]|nr:hypothetical protein [Bacteroidota bacterium]